MAYRTPNKNNIFVVFQSSPPFLLIQFKPHVFLISVVAEILSAIEKSRPSPTFAPITVLLKSLVLLIDGYRLLSLVNALV